MIHKLSFLSLFLVFSITLHAQPIIGWNMPNATTTIKSAADTTSLLDFIPQGGSFSWRDRFDKGDESTQNIINIYNTLARSNRYFNDIFTAGDDPAVDYIAAIRSLKNAGVPVNVVEYVNEAFYPAGGYNFTWSLYEPGLIAFCNLIKVNWPEMIVSIPLAPRASDAGVMSGSNLHKQWNDAAFAFITAHPEYKLGVSIHIYYTGAEVPAMGGVFTDETGATVRGTWPAKRIYNYQTDFTDDAYWTNIYNQADPSKLWDPELAYIRSRTSAPIYVTECGFVNTGTLNGSYVYGAKIWELLNKYGSDTRLSSINVHAGFTASTPGAFGPRKTFDVRDKNNLNNVSGPTWDAEQLYLQQMGIKLPYADGITLGEGTYSLWYMNNGFERLPIIIPAAGCIVNMQTIYGVTAKRISSIGRNMEFTLKGSVLGADEVTRPTEVGSIKPISFGYISVQVTKIIVPPVAGCMDPAALNYNPLAVVSNGNCTYPPPPPPPPPVKQSFWCRVFHIGCK